MGIIDFSKPVHYQHNNNVYSTLKGYQLVSYKGKGVLLHRLLMEIYLMRNLESWEHVHHKDGNKKNNSLTNLVVLSHSEHSSIPKGKRYKKVWGTYSKFKV